MRDELEHLLDDDNDMAEMYLAEKSKIEDSSVSSINEQDDMDENDTLEMDHRHVIALYFT